MTPLVRLESLSKTYTLGGAPVHALRDVSFTIERGEMVAIMGASGSGKSTTLNVIGTLDRPTSGRYFLDDEPVEGLEEDVLAGLRNQKIGFVFQSFNTMYASGTHSSIGRRPAVASRTSSGKRPSTSS